MECLQISKPETKTYTCDFRTLFVVPFEKKVSDKNTSILKKDESNSTYTGGVVSLLV